MDDKIAQIIDEKETNSFGIRIPKNLLDKILLAYKKKYAGAIRGNLKGPAIIYFAALGFLTFEEQELKKSKTITKGKIIPKPVAKSQEQRV